MAEPDRDYELRQVLDAYRRDGSLIREKARVLTEEGLDTLYRRMCDMDMPTSAYLDIMKYLAEIGDLKPKASTTPQNTGPTFSISINIPQADGKPPITLEAISVPDGDGGTTDVSMGDVPMKALKDLSDDA